jgi:biotin carboxylase
MALQEFLDGDEYVVDTVSYEGKHLLVACWLYGKARGLPWDEKAILTEQNELLAPTGEKQDALVQYVFKVLDAVGLRHGVCHTEVIFTKRGPVLVEVNARMHGLQGPRLIELATGISKATYWVDALMGHGVLFNRLYQEERPGRYLYPRLKQCVQLVLISGNEGYLINDIKGILAALELPSIIEILPAVKQGEFINRSRDLPTAAGTVLMVHESMDQIKADTAKIRDLERKSLYEVSVTPLDNSKPIPPARSRASTLDSAEVAPQARVRLYSYEKSDELWSGMNAAE